MKVAIVILNWNTREYLQRFLPALLDSVREFNAGEAPGARSETKEDEVQARTKEADSAEVIVADNASTDDSLEVMEREFPTIRTISLDKNYGFTGGYNRAFRILSEESDNEAPGNASGESDNEAAGNASGESDNEAAGNARTGEGYDLFLLLNSDIEVTPGWLSPLVDWMKTHPECGACGPKLHSWYQRDSFEYAGAAGGLIDALGYPFCRGRVMKKVEKDTGQYDSPADVLWVSGACLMVRSSVWKALGGLDDRFFAHMEEIDLCWRMQLRGWKVTVVPSSTVYHLGGGTLPQTSPWKLYLNFRNNILLLDNNLSVTIGPRKARGRIFLRKILDGCSAAVYLLSLRPKCFTAVWKAHRDAARLKKERRAALRTTPGTGNGDIQKGNRVCGIYGGLMIPRALLGLGINTAEACLERNIGDE